MTVSAAEIKENNHRGQPLVILEVNVLDIKLDKEIRLNSQMVAPSVPQPWHTVVLPSN